MRFPENLSFFPDWENNFEVLLFKSLEFVSSTSGKSTFRTFWQWTTWQVLWDALTKLFHLWNFHLKHSSFIDK